MKLFLATLGVLATVLADAPDYHFPDDFVFGVATAAVQIEGAWNEDGKSPSVIDHLYHDNPEAVADGSNADITCDSYHKYKEDVQLIKTLGVDFYRFSISWPRILPNGKDDEINQLGIDYYNNLIEELLANDIQPYVTIYHGDLPQVLEEEGGWNSDNIPNYFANYSRILFENFGDRVKIWITLNEPLEFCGLRDLGESNQKCARNAVLAHAKAYRLYEKEFKKEQNGQMTIVIDGESHQPNNTDSELDQQAAEAKMILTYGWFADPLVYGNYPDLILDNFETVVPFTTEEQELIKGALDFLGLNHYTTDLAYFENPEEPNVLNIVTYQPDDWPSSFKESLRVVPWGFRKELAWMEEHYNNIPIMVTENGYPDGDGTLEDYERADYYKQYLYAILEAIHEDGCNILGYAAWSLMDNWEWSSGFTQKFGLHYVDFDDPDRPRTRKLSSYVYSNIVNNRYVDMDYVPEWPPNDKL